MEEKQNCLKTPRLVMKNLEEDDREAFLRIVSDDRVKKTYMLPDFADQAQANAFFDRLQNLCGSLAHFIYGIYLNGEVIGFLNDCEIDGTGVELGYFISSTHWNHGYASEALQAAITELFRMGFDRIRAGYFAENPASRRVMEKSGMKPLPEETMISYRWMEHRCLFCEISREKHDHL